MTNLTPLEEREKQLANDAERCDLWNALAEYFHSEGYVGDVRTYILKELQNFVLPFEKSAYKEGVQDALKAVPEDEECGRAGQEEACAAYSKECRHDGFTICRTQTLQAIKSLIQ